jgi:hypothetical protein
MCRWIWAIGLRPNNGRPHSTIADSSIHNAKVQNPGPPGYLALERHGPELHPPLRPVRARTTDTEITTAPYELPMMYRCSAGE